LSRVGLGRHGKIEENAGDPLDGLVNLFDIGIVLAVAFLMAGLTLTVNPHSGHIQRRSDVTTAQSHVLQKASGSPRARGQGQPVGEVYRLSNGRLIYVKR
jgi:hypothetical protein